MSICLACLLFMPSTTLETFLTEIHGILVLDLGH